MSPLRRQGDPTCDRAWPAQKHCKGEAAVSPADNSGLRVAIAQSRACLLGSVTAGSWGHCHLRTAVFSVLRALTVSAAPSLTLIPRRFRQVVGLHVPRGSPGRVQGLFMVRTWQPQANLRWQNPGGPPLTTACSGLPRRLPGVLLRAFPGAR